MVVSANISNGGLAKTGSGTLVLSGANTYTGGTTLSQGAITLGSTQAGAVSALGGSASAFNFAGGILNANDKTASVGALSLTANSTLNLSPGGTSASLTFASAALGTLGTTLTINGWSGTAGVGGEEQMTRFSSP